MISRDEITGDLACFGVGSRYDDQIGLVMRKFPDSNRDRCIGERAVLAERNIADNDSDCPQFFSCSLVGALGKGARRDPPALFIVTKAKGKACP